jgi:long-chain fatty acid transport protein
VTVQPSSTIRIGAHYRSAIKYDLEGTAMFSAAPVVSGPVRADLKVPDTFSMSVAFQATPNLELMGDATWTGWSSVQQLVVTRTSAVPGAAAGSTLTTLPFLWDDTWRLGVGANYRFSPQSKLRFGVAHDQTPTNDLTRTPRLPDQSRTWLAFGLQYKPSKQGTLELAYAHEFVKDAAVNVSIPVPPPTPATNLIGTFKNRADIISIQYSHVF